MVGKDPFLAKTHLIITRQAEFGHVSTEVKIFPTYIQLFIYEWAVLFKYYLFVLISLFSSFPAFEAFF